MIAIGAVGISSIPATKSFTDLDGGRGMAAKVTDGSNALVGLTVYSPVQKNSQDPLVEIQNNTSQTLPFEVSLTDCSQGTLHDPSGDTGCGVSFSLAPGSVATIDITAAVSGVSVPFSIQAGGSGEPITFSAPRQTQAESGNNKGAVSVVAPSKDKDFTVRSPPQNEWTVKKVQVKDADGDSDLDRVELDVRDSSGTVRGSRTLAASGGQLNAKNLSISPNSGYTIQSGEVYQLTVTGYDADGNFDTQTVQNQA